MREVTVRRPLHRREVVRGEHGTLDDAVAQVGQEPESSTSAYVRTRIQRERQTYAPLVKAANIKAE